MRTTSNLFRVLPLGIALLGNCVSVEIGASIPDETAPNIAGYTLDQAAVACLDWAWSVQHNREVAGGVIWNDEGELTCSRLTVGTRNAVQYDMDSSWLVQFHTHVGPGKMSPQDRKTVAHLDPLGRPGYIREPSGAAWVYECTPGERERDCSVRRVQRSPDR